MLCWSSPSLRVVAILIVCVGLGGSAFAGADSSTPPAWFEAAPGVSDMQGDGAAPLAYAAAAAAMYAPTVDVLLVQDVYPWAYNSNEIALSEAGVSYAVITSADLASSDMSGVRCLMYASDQPTSYYVNVSASIDRIEAFVANGGTLIAHACDEGWQGGTWDGIPILPAGMNHISNYSWYVHIVDPSHPVVTGLTDEYFYDWNWSTHGYFTDVPEGVDVVMECAPGQPTYIEYGYGAGRVLATVQTIEWGFGNGTNANLVLRPDFLRNEIAYARTYFPSAAPREPGVDAARNRQFWAVVRTLASYAGRLFSWIARFGTEGTPALSAEERADPDAKAVLQASKTVQASEWYSWVLGRVLTMASRLNRGLPGKLATASVAVLKTADLAKFYLTADRLFDSLFTMRGESDEGARALRNAQGYLDGLPRPQVENFLACANVDMTYDEWRAMDPVQRFSLLAQCEAFQTHWVYTRAARDLITAGFPVAGYPSP